MIFELLANVLSLDLGQYIIHYITRTTTSLNTRGHTIPWNE